MRRALIFYAASVLFLSSFAAAPVSFAGSAIKDTTWFDLNNLQTNYRISTENQLIGLCSLVNEEQRDQWKPSRVEHFEGVTFTLTKDIVLTKPWIPIGTDDSAYFAGIFDGNGHTISGLDVNTSYGGSGLFGYLSGEVRNLHVKGKNESFDSNSGGIAGILTNSGKVINCTSSVNVQGLDKCGGIVGNNEGGTIEGCINIGNISGTYKIGGIVGENWNGVVTDCSNEGKVKSIRRGVATYGTGGVAGRSVSADAKVTKCHNTGKIYSNTEATGGVVGYMNGSGATINKCYNTGTINISIKTSDKEISPAFAGGIVGIVGTNGVTIRNCYNTGMINNPDISGGIIGRYRNDSEYKIYNDHLANNYYLSRAFSLGIGLIDNTQDNNLDKAVKGVSATKMHNIQNAGSQIYGQVLLDLLSPKRLTSNAFALYMEAQDKIEELKEKETKNYEQQ